MGIIEDYYNNKSIKNYDHDKIVELIKSGKIKFPYLKYRISKNKIIRKFNDLKNYQPNFENKEYQVISLKNNPFFDERIMKFKNEYTLLVFPKSDYMNYNILSDYFNENCRMKCQRSDQKYSPYEFFIKFPEKVIQYSLKKYNDINLYTLRESIWRLIKECTSFRPPVIVSIIKKFKSKKVLDFSAGWGDRLIGALACNVEYTGVDPNDCVHKGYREMIKIFGSKKINLIHSGFEDAKITGMFDLIFTSPPYFDLEIYTKDKTQSVSKYKELDDWLNNFLLFSLKKAWEHLIKTGYMMIIINNKRGFPDFVGRMIAEVLKFKNSEYLGAISYTEEYRSPQPIWIFHKI